MKIWQAIVAAVVAAVGTYFGTAPRAQVQPPAPPAQDIPIAPPPRAAVPPDPVAAIARIQFGNSGCTATPIAPRRPDGRYDVLTAAHCVTNHGQTGTMTMRDGRKVGVVVTAIDRTSDCAWLVTVGNTDLPFAVLADTDPAPGEKIWHRGYGVHFPGSLEEGTVTARANRDGQIEFRLSVSSGDSGGAIALNSNGEVVGAVCCTTARNQVARVWGCSPTSAAKLRAHNTGLDDDWTPIEVPLRMEP
jgi:hypothetical protein